MKKLAGILLAAALVFALAACGSQSAGNSGASSSSSSKTASQSASSDKNTSGQKILVVYFSPANADTTDAVTSATPRVKGASSVEYIANRIHSRVKGDIAKIVPQTAYPTGYEATANQAESEQKNDERPKFTLSVNPEDYDVIFVGYPMWYYEMPMIMQTFFDTYDFSGKTIIPFNTHAGSGDGGTYDTIKKLEPNATVRKGLPIAGDEAGSSNKKIANWLAKLGY